jgi:hypothetical protein
MVINMDETKLRTIAQLQEFLDATPEVSFTDVAGEDDTQRYEHISRVLKRFDYPRRNKRERGVVLPGSTVAGLKVASTPMKSSTWPRFS